MQYNILPFFKKIQKKNILSKFSKFQMNVLQKTLKTEIKIVLLSKS